MNNERNNGRGIFYGVIGVATLVVAIIGATFAYFTATASNNIITGNMAKVSLSLAVTKVTKADELKGGMIPLSNGMVEQAVNKIYKNTEPKESGEGTEEVDRVCIDDNGNAVCQIYKITITNDSTAGQFVDGYVALRGGSGVEPTDMPFTSLGTDGVIGGDGANADTAYSYTNNSRVDDGVAGTGTAGTTMRWAQVFPVASTKKYSTAGTQNLGAGAEEEIEFGTALGSQTDPKALANIRTRNVLIAEDTSNALNNGKPFDAAQGVLAPVKIASTVYNVIGTNYIRLSDHAWADSGSESYDRTTDITSALVFNNSIPAGGHEDYYVVVWLSETGTNQTPGATLTDGSNPVASKFFLGNVTFVSAQGSEVSATFSGYSRVPSDSVQAQ